MNIHKLLLLFMFYVYALRRLNLRLFSCFLGSTIDSFIVLIPVAISCMLWTSWSILKYNPSFSSVENELNMILTDFC